MTLAYLHLDVFTTRRFEGNQLAVFLDARGCDAATMQTLAREMNFSESTFLLPAEDPVTDIRMRIFTPGIELPIAGHPTIGTTFALAHAGIIAAGRETFTFGLGVGPTRVEMEWEGERLAFAWMDQLRPEFRAPRASADLIARAAGADLAAHQRTGLPVEEVSCGVPYLLLPLATRADVDAATADTATLATLQSAFDVRHTGIYLFSTEDAGDGVTAYARMFAPGFGIVEDPATGSACGPLGCYLVRHGLVRREAASKIVSSQGVAMGRPSRIHVNITQDASGAITRVQVGGAAVVVAQGELQV
jgi:trans-2,3-dihydro-3-hydroxyanthranilate isomerase